MSCCGVTIEAHRNADLRKTYEPRGRNYTFAGFSPLMQIRDGSTVLMTISLSATANGSVFSVVGDALTLTLKKADVLALASGPGDRLLSYDIVLSQGGIESWFVGGDFIVLDINATTTEGEQNVTVDLDGQTVDVAIMGGNIGIGASVLLADLNSAVEDAEASAAAAAASLAAVPGLATTAGAAAGTTAGATAGTTAGTSAGATAGTTAANTVVAGKANVALDNVVPATGRAALGLGNSATQNVGTTNTTVARGDVPFTQSGTGTLTRSVYVKEQETLSAADFTGFDGTGVTASTTAIQAAINNAQATGRKLQLPSGFKLDGALTITAPITIAGDKRVNIAATGGTYNLFTIQSSEVFISNLFVDSSGKTGGWDFVIDTGAGLTREQITIENVFSLQSKGMVTDSGTGLTSIVKLQNIYGRQMRGQHTKFQRNFAYLDMEDCTADYNGSAAIVSAPAFEMIGTGLPAGSGGGVFKTCHVLGDAVSGNAAQTLWRFKDYRGAWFDDACTADSGPGIGYDFDGCIKLRGEIEASLNNGVGIRFSNCIGVDMRINGQGRNGIGGAAASVPLIQFAGTGNATINLSLGNVVDSTGNLIETAGAQAGAINLHGGIASGAGGRAIKTLGASSVQWTGSTIGANTGGSYDFASNLNTIEGVFPSGARTTVTGPGVG